MAPNVGGRLQDNDKSDETDEGGLETVPSEWKSSSFVTSWLCHVFSSHPNLTMDQVRSEGISGSISFVTLHGHDVALDFEKSKLERKNL